MNRKIIASLLTICMVFTMIPAFTFAASNVPEKDPLNPEKISKNIPSGTEAEDARELAQPVPDKAAGDPFHERKTAKTASYVASVNGSKYYSLQEAINAANKGDTVTLLANQEESISINKKITLNLNKHLLFSETATDIIAIEADGVTVKNGYVENYNYYPADHATGFYIYDCDDVSINNVNVMTVGGSAVDQTSSAFYIDGNAFASLTDCQVYYDKEYVSASDWINGAYVASGAAAFTDCSFEILYGSACFVEGDASMENCYFSTDADGSAAIDVMGKESLITIVGGYYYGDPAVYTDNAHEGATMIIEGEFHSAYKDVAAFGGKKGTASEYGFNGMNVIASPKNWKTSKTANHVFIYEGASVPAYAKANLTAVKGTKAGYDDIKFTWGRSNQSDFYSESGQKQADGYKVSYKRGSGNYGNAKIYKKTATRARTITNLSDGYKYTFKVTPYVLVNEKLFGVDEATKCYSNKYKVASTYTLKKVVLNKFSKSSSKVKVTWKNISGETGYQISKSTKKSGTNIVSTYKTTTGTYKLISATKGKTYYYKVRAYKTVDGKKIYGPWSAVKAYKR